MAIILSSSASEDTPPVIRAASLPHLSDSDGVTGMFRPTRLAVASILSSDVKSTRGLYLSNSVLYSLCDPMKVRMFSMSYWNMFDWWFR